MCYNATVSAATFLGTGAVCLFLWHRGRRYDHAMALLLFVVSLMQALEWGLWLHLDCDPVNQWLTAAIPLLLYAQPLVLNATVAYYNAGWAGGYATIASVLAVLLGFKAYEGFARFGTCATAVKGHLQWNKTDPVPFSFWENKVYAAAMLYPLVTFKNTLFGILYSVFGLVSLYGFQSVSPTTWPSIWCHFVNILSVFAIVAN
jgi:hypothetical protein